MVSKPWSNKGRMRSQFSIVLVIHKLIEVDIIIITMMMNYHNDTADDNDIS